MVAFRLADIDTSGIRGRLTPGADMSAVTWFRVGGPADLLFQPADEDDLALFLARLDPTVPVTVVGIGSNLLIRDGGIRGVVIRLSAKGFGEAELLDNGRFRVGAALPDKRLAAFALAQGLDGFAFYHGIPGGVGGALRMNAGANGGETAERLCEVTAIDRTGRRLTLSKEDMGYSYRLSGAASDLIFTAAVFAGSPAAKEEIQAAMAAVQAHREKAQPVREKTGGSTFTNPPGARAWELIDRAGCRGLAIGGAQVSEMHCNFLINTGAASSHDIELLGETVRARVLQSAGVRLHWEIKKLGEFGTTGTVEPFLGEG